MFDLMYEITESSEQWAKTLKKLARQKKLDNITSKDKETLLKIVRMVKTANEAKKKKDMILGDKEQTDENKEKGSDGKACWSGYKHAGTDPKTGKDKCVKESFNPLKHPRNKY